MNDETDFDCISSRRTLEINQLYQSNDPKLIQIALLLKEASAKAYKGCTVQNDPDYSLYAEVEKHAIYLESKQTNQHNQFVDRINRSLELYNPLIIDTSKYSHVDSQLYTLRSKALKGVWPLRTLQFISLLLV